MDALVMVDFHLVLTPVTTSRMHLQSIEIMTQLNFRNAIALSKRQSRHHWRQLQIVIANATGLAIHTRHLNCDVLLTTFVAHQTRIDLLSRILTILNSRNNIQASVIEIA